MGKVEVKFTVINRDDIANAQGGFIKPESVRKLELIGLVDTGSDGLCLPIKYINQLGLKEVGHSKRKTANGDVLRRIFGDVMLNIMGREAPFRVSELPDDIPPLIGFIILETFDFVVDPKNQILTGNPEHGGEWIGYEY